MASGAEQDDEEEPRDPPAHQNACPTAKWKVNLLLRDLDVATLPGTGVSAPRVSTWKSVPRLQLDRDCRPRRAGPGPSGVASRMPDAGRHPDHRTGVPAAAVPDAARVHEGGEPEPRAEQRATAPAARRCRPRACCRRWPRPWTESGLICRVSSAAAVHLALGDDVDHRAELVALEAAHVVGAAGVEPLLRRDEVAALGGDVHASARRWRRRGPAS